MDSSSLKTVVSVHSPLIQCCSKGSYYTSYAISLKSNDPCFNYSCSQIRRRYSDFIHLRRMLVSHHPTVKPPILPPKNYFQRFSIDFIEKRKKGLQTFLDGVLKVPVYLSDKGLHLFLQSSYSMSEIDEQCLGDIPVPQLVDTDFFTSSHQSDSSSTKSSENTEVQNTLRVLENFKIGSTESTKEIQDIDANILKHGSISSKSEPQLISTLSSSMPCPVPKWRGSLDSSSPSISPSSFDTSYNSSLESSSPRRVSFNENVTVAVVCNQFWNIGVKPIRTDA
ncbi:sorting nexin-10A-like [Stegodyphus dumicola]|uniref:sorting nexin-10A-like n=1 Tax=Stegodyphus dumicola TaxID=202533 RepID=UPI0015ADF79E|nr:sorting nexin-10A-like [Stegodyphus dumicola]